MQRQAIMSAPGVAGLVLAAGMSRRLPGRNKLLASMGGAPIVRHTVEAYLEGGLAPVLVVVGYQADLVGGALTGLPVTLVENPDFEVGQSRSLRRGLQSIPRVAGAAVIGVGDQPFLTGEVVRTLVSTAAQSGARLVVPRYAGRRGNPVLFHRSLFQELTEVEGDQGGRGVLAAHAEEIAWVDVADRRTGDDVDTLDDLRRALDTWSDAG